MTLCKISPARPVLRMKKSSQTARLSSAMRDAPVYRTFIASSSAEDAFFTRFSAPEIMAMETPFWVTVSVE